ncbi:MAG: EAL domain-containing protein [Gammaproteobacteria bacterium]
MDGQTKHQPSHDELDQSEDHTSPMINPGDLHVPVGIISVDDGVVVYANDAFRKIVKTTKVGEPMKGFLHTPEIRKSIANKLERTSQYSTLLERPQTSLIFTITKGLFLEIPHYFVSIEKINNIIENNQPYLSREEYLVELSKLTDSNDSEDSSVCTFDVDRFKVVNEKYGYDAGNYVLNELVQVIKQYLPKENTIGRLGGNEFGVILKNVSSDDSVQICEVIRESVKDYNFEYNGESIEITLSIGVILITKEDSALEKILASANLALRSAQENGRDCVHSSATQDTMMAYHSGKMHYALVIEDALQNDKFELFAQPIVNLNDQDSHYSYEVLLRIFDHKKNDFVSSQELISAAESLEVTTRIDQWVCERVFKDIGEKVTAQVKIPNISINLSGHSIVSVAFEKFLLGITDKYEVPTSCICFEITESVAVKSITRAQNFIHNLKAVGYKFSLDDFGVGYCSFNYLNQLDVDHVKIDGSFVSAMLDDATQFATVQAITSVARTMNIKTIAEFVEKPEIIKALKVIGVDYGQGYIFGKPSPMKDIFKA